MSPSTPSIEDLFQRQIQTLALTLRPGTVSGYRYAARRFVTYLRAAFPQLRQLGDLHRDPHLLGWFRSLCEQQSPLSNKTRADLIRSIRRLLHDLAGNGHVIMPDLIRRQDFPRQPIYLPKPLSLEDDRLLLRQLRSLDDLRANALLLTRATGIRIGECVDLSLNCLRQIGPDQWALHVPLGKLHTERLAPVDNEVRRIVARLLQLRALAAPSSLSNSTGFLLPRGAGRKALYTRLAKTLAQAGKQAGCSCRPTPHQLRHTFATEMIRLRVSLPALMHLLGHRDIRMTLRYVQVTQEDLHREYHAACRRGGGEPHRMPVLAVSSGVAGANPPGIRQAIDAARHLLEMYRRQLNDEKQRRTLQRLDCRLLAVASKLAEFPKAEK
jgi:site-specific recombinase XerD